LRLELDPMGATTGIDGQQLQGNEKEPYMGLQQNQSVPEYATTETTYYPQYSDFYCISNFQQLL
jgi:hypothetical protein